MSSADDLPEGLESVPELPHNVFQEDMTEIERASTPLLRGQQVFGKYRLIRIIGKGGMGEVWQARHEVLNESQALKFLSSYIRYNEAQMELLKQETKKSMRMTHENIVKVLGVEQDDDNAAMVMEYIDGHTLDYKRLLQENKVFEARHLEDWVVQICSALDYAHNKAAVVHRDIKPANIMVNERGVIKIADFGVARTINNSIGQMTLQAGSENFFKGTPVYASPEQLSNLEPQITDDIYALGATLYCLMASSPPFNDQSGEVLRRQVMNTIPPTITQKRLYYKIEGEPIPPVWEKTIALCLHKNPKKRPQGAMEICRLLGLIEDVPVGRGGLLPRVAKESVTRKKAEGPGLWLIVGLSLLLVFGGIYTYVNNMGGVQSMVPGSIQLSAIPQDSEFTIREPMVDESGTQPVVEKGVGSIKIDRNRYKIGGKYLFTFEKRGYTKFEGYFRILEKINFTDLDGNDIKKMPIELIRQRGELRVDYDSKYGECKIVDGEKDEEKSRNASLYAGSPEWILAGDYTLSFRGKDSDIDWKFPVSVPASGLRVKAGVLRLQTNESNASISLKQGSRSMVISGKDSVKIPLPEGIYIIGAKLGKQALVDQTVDLKAGSVATTEFIFKKNRLTIKTKPIGATVYLRKNSKREMLGLTPLSTELYLDGDEAVLISQDGYLPVTKQVQLNESGSFVAEVDLEQKEELKESMLNLQTVPKGASVTLNGSIQTSPASFKSLKPGSYPLSIELPGYKPLTRQVTIVAGENTIEPIVLTHEKGKYEINLDPAGAEYEICDLADNIIVEKKRSPDTGNIDTGEYIVKMFYSGFDVKSQKLTIKSEVNQKIEFKFHKSKVLLKADLPGGQVWIEGRQVGDLVNGIFETECWPGKFNCEIRSAAYPGYVLRSPFLEIKEGGVTEFDFSQLLKESLPKPTPTPTPIPPTPTRLAPTPTSVPVTPTVVPVTPTTIPVTPTLVPIIPTSEPVFVPTIPPTLPVLPTLLQQISPTPTRMAPTPTLVRIVPTPEQEVSRQAIVASPKQFPESTSGWIQMGSLLVCPWTFVVGEGSWEEANKKCHDNGFRLPTVAEWKACKEGLTRFGDSNYEWTSSQKQGYYFACSSKNNAVKLFPPDAAGDGFVTRPVKDAK